MADTDETTERPGLALSYLWGTDSRGRRPGPKPSLTLDAIVEAALRIARSDGLPAVSMTAVAQSVGCSKMALYRHVSNHQDLRAAMVDAALGEPPSLSGTWRARFTVLWHALLDLYERDPWLCDLPSEGNAFTPQNAAWIEAGLGLFETSTLQSVARLDVILLIIENARFVARRRRSSSGPVDDLDRLLSTAASGSEELAAGAYPHLAALGARSQNPQSRVPFGDRVQAMMIGAVAGYFPGEETA